MSDIVMTPLILGYLAGSKLLVHVLVFLGMFVEGDAILFLVGFLTHRGFFDARIIFPLAFVGVIIGDMLWYWLGTKPHLLPKFVIRWIGHLTTPFDSHLKEKPLHILFATKFVYGIHHAIFTRISPVGLPFRTFIRCDLIATFLWMTVIGIVGYLSSASFFIVRRYLHYAEAALLLGVLLFIGAHHFIAKVSKKVL